MRAELNDDARLRFFIGCIRDKNRVIRAMQGVDLVIHAAALKRIQTGRYDAPEMTMTNVFGTINVIDAARTVGVPKVVGISSDKAYAPREGGCYGQTKALMETLMLTANDTSGARGPKYSICRYGNIFGSTGSILPKWIGLIRNGAKSVPVTTPEATRFFMLVDEAVELVLGTAVNMTGKGDIAVPELPAYRVGDLAEALEVDMNIIGMPRYEKIHESMAEDNSSDLARRMSVAELRKHVLEYMRENP
jgi:UDP-N-acetylglucosamine 4,6-dehydratase